LTHFFDFFAFYKKQIGLNFSWKFNTS
jgi:hypothetical protein